MISPVKTRIKKTLLGGLSRLTGRHAVLLPSEAAREESLLNLLAPYRIETPRLTVRLLDADPGQLCADLLAYAGHFPTKTVWTGSPRSYDGPCELTLDLVTGQVSLADHEWGHVSLPLPSRRFCWRLVLNRPDGRTSRRLTGHYRTDHAAPGGAAYYTGDNYVDHEAQTAGDREEIVRLLREYRARAPILEIGCATGGLLAALDRAGLLSLGLDTSEWAIEAACRGLGPGRAWVCDVERDQMPA